MIEAMSLIILIAAGLVTISIFTSVVSFRIGAPLLLVFLSVGLLAGVDGIGGIQFSNAGTAYFIGSLALAIILFDSGFGTRLQTVRVAAWPSLTLATMGVLLTTGLVGAAAHYGMGMPWLESLLIGAIISSTDAAAVFFLLRVGGITLKDRVRSTLEIESGSNDPMAIFLTISLVELIISGAGGGNIGWGLAEAFLLQMGLGALAGVAGGWIVYQVVNRIELEPALYPILVMALSLCLFAATSMIGGSGFLAVYIAGIYAGNSRLRFAASLRRFQSGMTWLAQIAMFLTLGLLATPSEFPEVAPFAIGLALFLIFIGRPIAVWLCLLPFGFTRNEITFIAWVGLRGAVSILLALLPILGNLPGGQTFFNTAFIIVLVSLLVQGWTIRPMAKWLGLIVPPRIGPVERMELDLPGQATHELVAYRISPESPVAEGDRLPRWARPSLIVRDGRSMAPHGAGKMQPGDTVFIFTLPKYIHLLDRLFARPAKLDVLDRELFGDFSLPPDTKLQALSATYGFSIRPEDTEKTVAELVQKNLRGQIEIGDRLSYGPIEIIVRDMVKDEITEMGLALEPTRPSQPRLPLFQTKKDLKDFWLRLTGRNKE
ncbi:potassium/proton antiporter [Telmatospirillum sp. J64-1]|uniref:potassium/proton antiporter n=1 Tax=Telmatospirillum sp. J64-1 TaxID=2502183 RepID=UPI00115F57E4|nr:potassium/proton antiporter [Telmatospirillum sp. J64-1]